MNKGINIYLQWLLQLLLTKKNNALVQMGTSDMDGACYRESLAHWYDQLIELISNSPPSFYTKYLLITQDIDRKIVQINYYYYELGESIFDVSLKILII